MSIDQWYNTTIGNRAVEALRKNHFDAVFCATTAEAVDKVLGFVTPGAKVGMGGSATLGEMDLASRITGKGGEILNHNAPGLTAEEKMELRRQQLTCDLFLSSTNALTLTGCLVNVDNTGNRVGAMFFGPKKVVVIAGINKVVKDVDAAFERLDSVASPKNNKRLNTPNPCVTTGVCADCQGRTRICNIFVTLRKKPAATDMTVIVVGENLGY